MADLRGLCALHARKCPEISHFLNCTFLQFGHENRKDVQCPLSHQLSPPRAKQRLMILFSFPPHGAPETHHVLKRLRVSLTLEVLAAFAILGRVAWLGALEPLFSTL
jgi:hypothetical protein